MTNPRWKTLSEGLSSSIPDGYRVTHALFTSYALETAFFEENILPLILPHPATGLSLHAAVRKLQLEATLREQRVPIDVYFDARVAVPGVPWLPYTLHPVSMGDGEFHGKVILLRLEQTTGKPRTCWLLGAGSSNLTKAGWWENQEVWHFCPPFDPQLPPPGISHGVRRLLSFLEARRSSTDEQDPATRVFSRELRKATRAPARGETRFGVFEPGAGFSRWLKKNRPVHEEATVEIISPYFGEGNYPELVAEVCQASGAKQAKVWLPHDPWEPGSKAVRLTREQFNGLGGTACWSRLIEPGLAKQREANAVPRFLHAKVIRVPNAFTFIGSVNFSNKGLSRNFEAGFLFPIAEAPWLDRDDSIEEELRFLEPRVDVNLIEVEDDDNAVIVAQFDWRLRRLSLAFLDDSGFEIGMRFTVFDAHGKPAGQGRLNQGLGAALRCNAPHPLPEALRHHTWITLRIQDRYRVVWVQQVSLEFRPAPVDLTPDAWRILDFWRQLSNGQSASRPCGFEALEIYLRTEERDGDEAPPPPAGPEDLFASMARAHGSFYALQKSLVDNPARAAYYFAADRPDSLRNLFERLDAALTRNDFSKVDAVEAWVMLNWIQQICSDHSNSATAKVEASRLRKRTLESVARLEAGPLASIDCQWLQWARAMFLAPPKAERTVAKRLLQAWKDTSEIGEES